MRNVKRGHVGEMSLEVRSGRRFSCFTVSRDLIKFDKFHSLTSISDLLFLPFVVVW